MIIVSQFRTLFELRQLHPRAWTCVLINSSPHPSKQAACYDVYPSNSFLKWRVRGHVWAMRIDESLLVIVVTTGSIRCNWEDRSESNLILRGIVRRNELYEPSEIWSPCPQLFMFVRETRTFALRTISSKYVSISAVVAANTHRAS